MTILIQQILVFILFYIVILCGMTISSQVLNDTIQQTSSHEIQPIHSIWNGDGLSVQLDVDKLNTPIIKKKEHKLPIEDLNDKFLFENFDHEINSRNPTRQEKGSVCSKIITTNGAIRGKEILSPTGKKVCGFLGIPFAEPPIGTLRFARPVQKKNWIGILEATRLPNSCPQIPYNQFPGFIGETMWNPNTNISEDCLYINAWVPVSVLENVGNIRIRKAAPILFWIHGGELKAGTSTLAIYDGSILAGNQEVIVVSCNFRLGPLGTIFFGNDHQAEVPGNIILLDQHLALKWMKDNADNFGGDPEKITLFGESAGSVCICYHLLSPISAPLFKRGILMSGASPLHYRSPSLAIKFSYEVAQGVGCYLDTDYPRKEFNEIIDCMRNVDAMTIMSYPYQYRGFLDWPSFVTMDGEFLPDTPENLLKNGRKTADLIIGNVPQEGSYFLTYAYPKIFGREETISIDYEKFQSIMRLILWDVQEIKLELLISKYTNWQNVNDSSENIARIISAAGDKYFTCPAINFATKWAENGNLVYYYYFNHRSSTNPWGKWMGIIHADDIEYIFGNPLISPSRPNEEKQLSQIIEQFMTNFARTGVPEKLWEPYTLTHPIILNLNMTLISTKSMPTICGLPASMCSFWNNYNYSNDCTTI